MNWTFAELVEGFSMSGAISMESLFALPVAERIALADELYASVPQDWQMGADQAWFEEATARSRAMDDDPSAEISHEQFLAGIKTSGAE